MQQEKSREFMRQFNMANKIEREKILKKWLKNVGRNCYIEPQFFCDYGCNLTLGNNVYMNTNCTVLDSAQVVIKDFTMIGSGVQICTPNHPLNPDDRKKGAEYAKPINIGENCWIGSGAIILAGITIGDNSIIGAGSVVTRDIAPSCVAVGNPCKVIKKL